MVGLPPPPPRGGAQPAAAASSSDTVGAPKAGSVQRGAGSSSRARTRMQAWLCEEPHDNAVSSSMEIAVGPRRVEASSQTAAPRVSVDAGTQTDSSSTTSPSGMPLTLARAPGWADVPLKAPPPVPPRHVEAPEVPQGDVPQPWKAPPHVRSASEEAGDPCTPAAISEHHHHHHHHTTTNVVSDVELVNGPFDALHWPDVG